MAPAPRAGSPGRGDARRCRAMPSGAAGYKWWRSQYAKVKPAPPAPPSRTPPAPPGPTRADPSRPGFGARRHFRAVIPDVHPAPQRSSRAIPRPPPAHSPLSCPQSHTPTLHAAKSRSDHTISGSPLVGWGIEAQSSEVRLLRSILICSAFFCFQIKE